MCEARLNSLIRRICRALSAITVIMSCLPAARADIFLSNGGGGQVLSYSEFTGAFRLYYLPCCQAFTAGVAVGPDNNLYVADLNNHDVIQFNVGNSPPTGVTISLPAPSAPFGITFGPGGSLYVADNLGYIWRFNGPPSFTSTGKFSCSSPAGVACYPYDLAFGPDGNLYVSESGGRDVLQLNGSTLEFMSQFVPPPNPNAFPGGLHFGSNGNLYVVWLMPQPNTNNSGYYNDIFQYTLPSGAPVIGYSVPYAATAQSDFAIGPDSGLIVAGYPSFTKYNPLTGSVLSTFGTPVVTPYDGAGFITIGDCIICTLTPPLQLYAPIGLDSSQTLRLTVIEGPVWVPPGVPVQVQLGFQNSQGAPVGPAKVATLNPGQSASLDLVASTSPPAGSSCSRW